jgi:IS5 family transposase
MLILKHLFDWSYDDLEREVRKPGRSGVHADRRRATCRDHDFEDRAGARAGVIEQLHARVVDIVKRAGVTHGRRFRIDTTVVETNVHYPTDSSLLQDGVRVLTPTMQRASAALGDARGRVRNRLRSVGRRVLVIGR